MPDPAQLLGVQMSLLSVTHALDSAHGQLHTGESAVDVRPLARRMDRLKVSHPVIDLLRRCADLDLCPCSLAFQRPTIIVNMTARCTDSPLCNRANDRPKVPTHE